MKRLWCWRCEAEVTMLDEREFAEMNALYGGCLRDLKRVMVERGHSIREVGEEAQVECYRPVTGWFSDRTGESIHHLKLRHHRIALYGPDCGVCGKPLRTSQATRCVECGWVRA